MERRRFVGVVAGSIAIAHSLAQAQPAGRVYRVGFLLGATRESVASLFGALSEGLRDLGYAEGRNIVIEQRYAGGQMERLPALATELVRLKVDVIVTGTNFHVAAVQGATKTIPVVMVFASDPVGSGFVESLARPGGNITGLSADASPELWAKYLALLGEVVPKFTKVGVLGQVSSHFGFEDLKIAAGKRGVAVDVADIKSPDEFDGVFAAMIQKRVDAAVVIVGPVTYQLRQRIGEATLKHRLPAITNLSEYAQAGLLMSYGPNLLDLYRRAAGYVDKILRGAKPADLPVEQPSRFELTLNLRAAKTLGVNIPPSLRLLAADVIE
ncbi:MAG TPA: ABC transporter substrate-binding protein [Burkholderiales bacterium]|nr:ABC transporter substrate-binding protein [Burkholderiales bacterium]